MVGVSGGRRRKDIDSSDDEEKPPSEGKLKYMKNPPTVILAQSAANASEVSVYPTYANGEATETDTNEISPVQRVDTLTLHV